MKKVMSVFRKTLTLTTILTIVILLLSQLSFAQEDHFYINGVVIDKYTQEPLFGANIIQKSETFYGKASDIDGYFELRIESIPTYFDVRYIGYEDYQLEVIGDKADGFVIEMVPRVTELEGPTVTDKAKPDIVFDGSYSVVDYEFYNGYTFLLAYKNAVEKYSLIAMDENDKIFNTLSLTDRKPSKLYKSCSGELHLITEVHAHKIELEEHGVRFIEHILLGEFEDYINPCQISNKEYVVMSRYFYQGQALDYSIYRKGNEMNKTRVAMIEDEPNIYRLFEDAGVKHPWSGDIWEEDPSEEMISLRDDAYDLKGMMKIFYPKLNAPIFAKDENFVLFNHHDKRIEIIGTTGNRLNSAPIEYPTNKKWKKQIYFDTKLEKAHTSFNTQWGEEICPIDLKTGQVGEGILLNMAFIEKVKAWNGYLYFLYKNEYRNERNNKLYKLPLNTN